MDFWSYTHEIKAIVGNREKTETEDLDSCASPGADPGFLWTGGSYA